MQDVSLGHAISVRFQPPLGTSVQILQPNQSGGGGIVYPISRPAVMAASQKNIEKTAAILALAGASAAAMTNVPSGAGTPSEP
jgi:hypothetical protein